MNTSGNTTAGRSDRYQEVTKYALSAVILAAGICLMLFLRSLAKPPSTRESTSLIPQVDVEEVVPYAGQLDLEVSGTVVPYREINVAAEVAGRVTRKSEACEAGNFVSKGEILLEIDPEEYRLDIATLEADIEQSQRRIEENDSLIEGEKRNVELAKSDLKVQKAEFERNRRLGDVLSQSELDQSRRGLIAAQSALTLRRNNLSSLEATSTRLLAALELSKRQLDKGKLNLRRATVVAPVDGVIVQEMVQQGDFVSRGTPLLMFEDTRQAEVLCNLTTSELAQVRKNATAVGLDGLAEDSDGLSGRSVYKLPATPVTLFDAENPDVQWSGVLERFDGIGVDSVTKTIPCRIAIEKPIVDTEEGSYALVRGMYVKCRLEFHASSGSEGTSYLAVPEIALHPNSHIWLVEGSKLKKKSVAVVDRAPTSFEKTHGRIAILEATLDGPQAGDQVVVSPLSQPTEDAEVEVSGTASKPAEESPASADVPPSSATKDLSAG